MRHVKVRVKAGAKKERILEQDTDTYIIDVREKPERGEANKRVRELLGEALGVPPGRLRLTKGARSPSKIYSLI